MRPLAGGAAVSLLEGEARAASGCSPGPRRAHAAWGRGWFLPFLLPPHLSAAPGRWASHHFLQEAFQAVPHVVSTCVCPLCLWSLVPGAPGGRATTAGPQVPSSFARAQGNKGICSGRGLGTVEGPLAWSALCGAGGPGGTPPCGQRPHSHFGPHGRAVQSPARHRPPRNFQRKAVCWGLYLPLVGVADFATRGQELSCPVFCVLNLIVALLFSLKKISKNC